jgi:NAD-dependent dihydropyrimidine dehydrogenase PreA subunit
MALFWLSSQVGDIIEPDDKAGLGNLARYIIRACFSQEKMVISRQRNPMMLLPRSFTHPRIENTETSMTFLTIDETKCKQDGICAAECPRGIIIQEDDKSFPQVAQADEASCMTCGHCVAV